ncbi:MAG: hypothetical protein HGB17_11470, partial [Syntrophobacteraceae bacterium]|nr:hypothetical protein [Syntrophobacteraceae bacterium]
MADLAKISQGIIDGKAPIVKQLVNDAIAEGVHTSSITQTAASADPNYSGIGVAGITANITDNDIAYVNFSLAAQSAQEDAGSMT